MNIITKDIKTIKDLRKYVNSIDWYNKEFNEKDQKQFNNEIIVQRKKDDGSNETAFKLSIHCFKSTISKRKQADVYKLPWATEQIGYHRYSKSPAEERLDYKIAKKFNDSDHSVRAYRLKNKWCYSNVYISDVLIYANEYTDEIVYVSYDREDIWWNNFFKDCLDASIKNNFNELNRVKKFNLVLRKEEYKTILTEGKTFKEALENFYKNNSDYKHEHEVESNRMPNVWYVWGTTALDKLPENESIVRHKDITSKSYYYSSDPCELGELR